MSELTWSRNNNSCQNLFESASNTQGVSIPPLLLNLFEELVYLLIRQVVRIHKLSVHGDGIVFEKVAFVSKLLCLRLVEAECMPYAPAPVVPSISQ
jgi:hypothetical protein